MKTNELEIEGVFGLQNKAFLDERGEFLRIWEKKFFSSFRGVSQASLATNYQALTLRGLHFQVGENAEMKIVQCISGAAFDVVVDLRQSSPTFGAHISLMLGPAEKYQGILVPRGFAHGYLTLSDNTSLLYFMDRNYSPGSTGGIVWNDPELQIDWPFPPKVISERDKSLPNFKF
jgi:dTDP-4-dehydrorhamnose 3,5-epimerase